MGRRANDGLQYRLNILLAVLAVCLAMLSCAMSVRAMTVSQKALSALATFREAVMSLRRPGPFGQDGEQ
jgi:hypothetical protein